MAAKTGNTYISVTMTDRIEILGCILYELYDDIDKNDNDRHVPGNGITKLQLL